MQIFIIGCGRVGATLARQLQEEKDCDLTLIDVSSDRLDAIADEVDALTIVGNGASLSTLMEAEIEKCDLLIAVTDSDELNLLCCLIAQKTGKCATIARVRNPVYSSEHEFFKERLGINMIINPEFAAATEIDNLHRLPTVAKVDTLARRRVDLLRFKIQPEYGLDGLSLMDFNSKFNLEMLVCGLENKNGIIIPTGSSVLRNGDMITLLASRNVTTKFFKKIGLKTTQVKTSIIVGGGTISIYLARLLRDRNIEVKIIEKNKEKCETLSDLLPDVTIIHGDGTNRKLLEEEGLANVGSLVCLTNMDEENIFLALYGKRMSKGKTIAKINRLENDEIFQDIDIGSLVFPKYITADNILQYVRAMRNASGSNVESLYHIMDGKAEALEFIIRESSKVVDVPLAQLKLKDNTLVGCISRDRRVFIPRGMDTIQIGDTVVIVTMHRGLNDIADILA